MIGNKIIFKDYDFRSSSSDSKPEEKTGIVVDAFTKVTGSVSGKSESFFGFGEGSTHGRTNSNRMYKVEYYLNFDIEKKHVYYKDIEAWQLVKIIEFANNFKTQEVNEEKITS